MVHGSLGGADVGRGGGEHAGETGSSGEDRSNDEAGSLADAIGSVNLGLVEGEQDHEEGGQEEAEYGQVLVLGGEEGL